MRPLAPGVPGTLVVPQDPIYQDSPEANATGVTLATPFSWEASPHSVYRVAIRVYDNFVDQRWTLYTASTQITLPDLAAVGAAFLPGYTYEYRIDALWPHGSVDDVVVRDALDGWTANECHTEAPATLFTMQP
jgi:hypothetical protein